MPKPTGQNIQSSHSDVAMSLPVVDGSFPKAGGFKRNNRMSRRRAAVLILIQLAIIVHVVIWALSKKYGWFGGATITPIEPSESMEFSKYGIVNAGLIFFVLALLSTMILGRWFCGWGCHVVMLQDFCLWIMGRFRIRPKPFKSRLLMWAPLVLAVYMFIWPLFYRFAIAPFTRPDLEWPGISIHLTTTDFWGTFPGVMVGTIFLGICGFATVYVLGAKGFCTYGCPYGGFFAPLDKLAPMRVRLEGSCDDCGICTAACTSNVRVHEEVRSWGMVTDPGCMKTMDCVVNCPTQALHVGFGKSAIGKKSVQIAEPKKPKWDLTIPEEIGIGILCLVLFWSWRGLYASIPLLMAIGIATVLSWYFWKCWRILTDKNISMHRWRLRYRGRLTKAGGVFVFIGLVFLLLSVQAFTIRLATWLGDRSLARVDMPVQMALDSNRPGLAQDDVVSARSAMSWFTLASSLDKGGIGFADDPNVRLDLARLHLIMGERDKALENLQDVRASVDPSEAVDRVTLMVIMAVKPPQEIIRFQDNSLSANPDWQTLRIISIDHAFSMSDLERVQKLILAGYEVNPDSLPLLQREAVMKLQQGETSAAISIMHRYLEIADKDAMAWATLARMHSIEGDRSSGDGAIQKALTLAPANPAVLMEAAGYYYETGRSGQARQLETRARNAQR